jgi:hypothetical protein
MKNDTRLKSLSGRVFVKQGSSLVKVAESYNALFQADATPLLGSLAYDENGAAVTGRAWTGATRDGSSGYAGADNSDLFYQGYVDSGDITALNGDFVNLMPRLELGTGDVARYYCISQAPTEALTTLPAGGKHAFVTISTHQGNLGGISGADEICRENAYYSGLSRNYIAMLSDSTSSFLTRAAGLFGDINSLGIYVRSTPSAMSFVSGLGDMYNGNDTSLSTAMQYTANGYAIAAYGTLKTWTGALSTGASSDHHCADWSSQSSGDQAIWGTPTETSGYWTVNGMGYGSDQPIATCEQYMRLTCLSE